MAFNPLQKRDKHSGEWVKDPNRTGMPATHRVAIPAYDDDDADIQPTGNAPQTLAELTTPRFNDTTAREGNICSDRYEERAREWEYRKDMVRDAIDANDPGDLDYLGEQIYLTARDKAEEENGYETVDDREVLDRLDDLEPWDNPMLSEDFDDELDQYRQEQISRMRQVEIDTPVVAFDGIYARSREACNADVCDQYGNVGDIMNDSQWVNGQTESSWSVDERGELVMRTGNPSPANTIVFRRLKPGIDPDDAREKTDSELIRDYTLPLGDDINRSYANPPQSAVRSMTPAEYDAAWDRMMSRDDYAGIDYE